MAAATSVRMELQGKDATKKAFDSVAQRAKTSQAKIGAALKFGAIALAVGAAAKKIGSSLDQLNKLNDIAQQAGTSATWLQKFTGAMGQAGINVTTEGLASSIQKLNASLVNTKKLNAFEKLGVDVSRLRGLKPEEAFMGFLDIVSKIPDEQKRLLVLQKGMEEQGLRLAPLMRQGPDAFKQSLDTVMAAMPAASESTVTLATNANNAFALVGQSFSAVWQNCLGSILTWADESFGGVDKAIMTTWEYVRYFGATFVTQCQTMAESVQQIVGLFSVDLVDGLKLVGIRIGQLMSLVAGPFVRLAALVVGIFSEDMEMAIESFRIGIDQTLADWESGLLEKHGMKPLKSFADRMTGEFAAVQERIAKNNAMFDAKATLSTGNAVTESFHALPELEEKTKTSVKNGVKEGLAAGIEAGSYDALKATAKAAMDGVRFVAGSATGASASPMNNVASSSKASADRLSSIESMMRQLLEVVRGGASSLAALETF